MEESRKILSNPAPMMPLDWIAWIVAIAPIAINALLAILQLLKQNNPAEHEKLLAILKKLPE